MNLCPLERCGFAIIGFVKSLALHRWDVEAREAHTNGIESLWAMLKRGIDGTYHHVSTKHLGMYVGEFAGRHNVRPLDTTDQMTSMAKGSIGKRLQYKSLIG